MCLELVNIGQELGLATYAGCRDSSIIAYRASGVDILDIIAASTTVTTNNYPSNHIFYMHNTISCIVSNFSP